jgi:hypothetical protein
MIPIKHNECGCRFWAQPCVEDGELIDPGHLGCPECAITQESEGKKVGLQKTISGLERLNDEGRIVVFDPVSGKTLSGSAITSIVANGPALQLGLHPSWWEDQDDDLCSDDVHTPVALCPCCVADDDCPGHEARLSTAIRYLRRLKDNQMLAIWDPVSRRLLSGQAIDYVCANGDAVQIGLAANWAGHIADGLDWGGETAQEDKAVANTVLQAAGGVR